jgi:hypothetical protein
MAINRAPFHALVDDDGSNSLGTPWNKAAIAGVLLDPIDAAIAAGGVTLLGTKSGATTTAGAELLGPVACPALAVGDAVLVQVTVVHSGGTAPISGLEIMAFDNVATASLILTGTTGVGDLGANGSGTYRVTLRRIPPGAGGHLLLLGTGAAMAGFAQNRGAVCGVYGAVDFTAGAGSVYLRHYGIAAGVTLYWTLTGHLLAGGAPTAAKPGDPDA